RGADRPDGRHGEQRDDAQLEKAYVVAQCGGDGSRVDRGVGDRHADPFSTARRDSAGTRCALGCVSSAIASIPAQASVAAATCSPLKKAASVIAAPAPSATWSASTMSVAIAIRRSAGRRSALIAT